MSAPKAPRSAATPSYQAKSLASHIRHAVPNKEAWDQLQTEYRRVHGSANDIGLVSDMIAFFLVFLSKERAALGAGKARGDQA